MTHHNDETSPIEQARAEVQQAIADAPERSRRAAATEGRRWYRRSVLAAAGVAVLVSLCLSSLALAISGKIDARVDDQELQVTTLRQLAADAKTEGEAANAELAKRGQTPVPIPSPGTTDDAGVLVASAAARVLASLPDSRPTTAQLGQAVAQYMAGNPMSPIGPTPQQISEALAGYFAVTPPPSGAPGRDCDPVVIPQCQGPPGPEGDKGEKGDAPTREEIQAAFADYIQSNPDALCPRGGEFAQLQVRLRNGGWADVWDCVVTVAPPPSTSSAPPPTTTPALVPVPTN